MRGEVFDAYYCAACFYWQHQDRQSQPRHHGCCLKPDRQSSSWFSCCCIHAAKTIMGYASVFLQMMNFQRDLQREAKFGVFERVAQDFLDASEAVEQGVAVEVHGARRFAEVAVAAEKALQRLNQHAVAASVSIQQWAERFLVEVVEFFLPIEVE